jgi:hypothetical protein
MLHLSRPRPKLDLLLQAKRTPSTQVTAAQRWPPRWKRLHLENNTSLPTEPQRQLLTNHRTDTPRLKHCIQLLPGARLQLQRPRLLLLMRWTNLQLAEASCNTRHRCCCLWDLLAFGAAAKCRGWPDQ